MFKNSYISVGNMVDMAVYYIISLMKECLIEGFPQCAYHILYFNLGKYRKNRNRYMYTWNNTYIIC